MVTMTLLVPKTKIIEKRIFFCLILALGSHLVIVVRGDVETTTSLPIIIIIIIIIIINVFSRAAPMAYGGSQARGLIGAVATSRCHSHSNVGSEPCLQPTPQLTAMLDP